MPKLRKIVATFIGGLLMGSSASAATNNSSVKNPIEAKIQKIMKALHAKKIQGIQSKTMLEYLEKNHKLNSIEIGKPASGEEEMNVGNWDTWNNWSNWDTWNNWSNWDTWNLEQLGYLEHLEQLGYLEHLE
jgi:hypothetical protein